MREISYRARCVFGAPILLLVLAALAPASFGWGCDGHKTIALIALADMSPRAKAEALELLSHLPPDPQLTHFCSSDPNPFVDVSTWPDDMRRERPETASWHYIDLPLGAASYDAKYCPERASCVVRALDEQIALLKNPLAPAFERALALVFVIHLTGDLHQPLHATSNNDRGGNCIAVSVFGQQPQEGPDESFKPNLHSVWDVDLVTKAMNGKSTAAFASDLANKFQPEMKKGRQAKVDAEAWAIESELVAQASVYGKLPVLIPVETPVKMKVCSDDNHAGERFAALHESIDAKYESETQEALERQLARAGARLAAILNDALR